MVHAEDNGQWTMRIYHDSVCTCRPNATDTRQATFDQREWGEQFLISENGVGNFIQPDWGKPLEPARIAWGEPLSPTSTGAKVWKEVSNTGKGNATNANVSNDGHGNLRMGTVASAGTHPESTYCGQPALAICV